MRGENQPQRPGRPHQQGVRSSDISLASTANGGKKKRGWFGFGRKTAVATNPQQREAGPQHEWEAGRSYGGPGGHGDSGSGGRGHSDEGRGDSGEGPVARGYNRPPPTASSLGRGTEFRTADGFQNHAPQQQQGQRHNAGKEGEFFGEEHRPPTGDGGSAGDVGRVWTGAARPWDPYAGMMAYAEAPSTGYLGDDPETHTADDASAAVAAAGTGVDEERVRQPPREEESWWGVGGDAGAAGSESAAMVTASATGEVNSSLPLEGGEDGGCRMEIAAVGEGGAAADNATRVVGNTLVQGRLEAVVGEERVSTGAAADGDRETTAESPTNHSSSFWSSSFDSEKSTQRSTPSLSSAEHQQEPSRAPSNTDGISSEAADAVSRGNGSGQPQYSAAITTTTIPGTTAVTSSTVADSRSTFDQATAVDNERERAQEFAVGGGTEGDEGSGTVETTDSPEAAAGDAIARASGGGAGGDTTGTGPVMTTDMFYGTPLEEQQQREDHGMGEELGFGYFGDSSRQEEGQEGHQQSVPQDHAPQEGSGWDWEDPWGQGDFWGGAGERKRGGNGGVELLLWVSSRQVFV